MLKGCLDAHVFLPYPRAIEVDGQFARLAHIVNICSMMRTVGSSDAHKLINVAFQRVVACDSLLTHRLTPLIQRAIQLIGETDGVILGKAGYQAAEGASMKLVSNVALFFCFERDIFADGNQVIGRFFDGRLYQFCTNQRIQHFLTKAILVLFA